MFLSHDKTTIVEQIGLCISTIVFTSCSPTKSGKQIQARFKYKSHKDDEIISCFMNVSYEIVAKTFTDETEISFVDFVISLFNLRDASRHRTLGLGFATSGIQRIVESLRSSGFESSTAPLRRRVASEMRAGILVADQKIRQKILRQFRVNIPKMIEDALSHGISPDELETMMKTSIVSHVLKS